MVTKCVYHFIFSSTSHFDNHINFKYQRSLDILVPSKCITSRNVPKAIFTMTNVILFVCGRVLKGLTSTSYFLF